LDLRPPAPTCWLTYARERSIFMRSRILLFLASDGRQKKVHWLMRRCEEFASRSVMLCCTQMLYTGAVIKSSQQQGELLCCSINCQSQAS
jgi:hypothetical protein